MELKKVNYISDEELTSYKKELFNSIINDSSFYKEVLLSSFTNEDIMSNLSLFDEWRKNFNIVKNIKSYQDCVKFNTFEKLILVRDKKFIDREYELLPYVLDNIVYNSRFIVKDFSDNFNSLSLRNIDSKTQLSLVKTQLKNKRKMLYFLGASRTGKTYLSIAIVNNFIKNSEGKVAFLNTTMRFQELIDLLFSKNVNDKNEFNNLLKEYSTCPLLVLDGLGNERKSEFIRDSILLPILKNRNNNKVVTIINSNYTLEELAILYSFNKEDGKIIANTIKNIINSQIESIVDFGSTPNLY